MNKTEPITPTLTAKWWHRSGKKIICDLCPRNCELSEGQRGFCFVRQNISGSMHLTTYGKSTGFCIDPIEKKPLNHFLPGTPVLSFGTAGCNLGCKFCQNWDISKSKEVEILSSLASPDGIVEHALKHKCRSIAFTYNDPIIWAEYAIDTAIVAREMGIKTVAVSSGYIEREARRDFFKHIDAANIDLKAFSERFYKNVTLSSLQPVLETLKWLKDESDTWFEITNLIIPDENDSEDELKRMCDWIADNLGADVPIHFTAFHPDYKMTNKIRTPTETLLTAREIASQVGLNFAYVGNVHHETAQNTYCPGCKKSIIARDWYELGDFSINNGKCVDCGTQIPGVFEDKVGDWGSKRQPVSIEVRKEPEDAVTISNTLKAKGFAPSTSLKFVPQTEFSEAEKREMLDYVKDVIRAALLGADIQRSLSVELGNMPAYGAFVTLKRGHVLRGCRGGWGTEEPLKLGDLLRDIAKDSALSDPRFPSVKAGELPFLSIEISLMYDPRPVDVFGEARLDSFEVGTHGLVIISEDSRGLLLPNVATENNWDAKTFIEQACLKANLGRDSWLFDTVSILTFRTVKFELSPVSDELEVGSLTPQILSQMFDYVDAIESRMEGEIQISKDLVKVFDSLMGVRLETQSGHSALRFGIGKSMLDLLQEAIFSIESLRGVAKRENDKVEKISIVSQPIELFAEDYPYRLATIGNSVLMAEYGNKATITFPGSTRNPDPVAYTFNSAGSTAEDWASHRARISAFALKRVGRRLPKKDLNVRAPVMAGRFYPASSEQIDQAIAGYMGAFTEGRQFYPALMLPHAGWQFCGPVIAKTLAGASLAPEIILIGPKHTGQGANLSAAAHEYWDIPGARIPILSQFRQYLIERVPELVADTEAHENEHGVEVLLPFLKKQQPELRILPIAVGSIGAKEIENLSRAIAGLYVAHLNETKRPLQLIISSDMNHYAPDEENQRRDKLALQALKSGDPNALLKVCNDQQISMCGLLPTVIIMVALKYVFKSFSPNVVAYQTSAAVTGDSSSVVGYAGVRFGAG